MTPTICEVRGTYIIKIITIWGKYQIHRYLYIKRASRMTIRAPSCVIIYKLKIHLVKFDVGLAHTCTSHTHIIYNQNHTIWGITIVQMWLILFFDLYKWYHSKSSNAIYVLGALKQNVVPDKSVKNLNGKYIVIP